MKLLEMSRVHERTAISGRLHDLVVKYLIHLKAAVRISLLESYETYKGDNNMRLIWKGTVEEKE